MNIKKCDSCKNTYGSEEDRKYSVEPSNRLGMIGSITLRNVQGITMCKLDLCDKCIDKIYKAIDLSDFICSTSKEQEIESDLKGGS